MRSDGHRTMALVRAESAPNTAHSRQTPPSPSPFTQKPIRAANLRAEGRAGLIPSGIRIVTAGCKLFYSNRRTFRRSGRQPATASILRAPPYDLSVFDCRRKCSLTVSPSPLPFAQVKTLSSKDWLTEQQGGGMQ
jgi:hypothetical protein